MFFGRPPKCNLFPERLFILQPDSPLLLSKLWVLVLLLPLNRSCHDFEAIEHFFLVIILHLNWFYLPVVLVSRSLVLTPHHLMKFEIWQMRAVLSAPCLAHPFLHNSLTSFLSPPKIALHLPSQSHLQLPLLHFLLLLHEKFSTGSPVVFCPFFSLPEWEPITRSIINYTISFYKLSLRVFLIRDASCSVDSASLPWFWVLERVLNGIRKATEVLFLVWSVMMICLKGK